MFIYSFKSSTIIKHVVIVGNHITLYHNKKTDNEKALALVCLLEHSKLRKEMVGEEVEHSLLHDKFIPYTATDRPHVHYKFIRSNRMENLKEVFEFLLKRQRSPQLRQADKKNLEKIIQKHNMPNKDEFLAQFDLETPFFPEEELAGLFRAFEKYNDTRNLSFYAEQISLHSEKLIESNIQLLSYSMSPDSWEWMNPGKTPPKDEFKLLDYLENILKLRHKILKFHYKATPALKEKILKLIQNIQQQPYYKNHVEQTAFAAQLNKISKTIQEPVTTSKDSGFHRIHNYHPLIMLPKRVNFLESRIEQSKEKLQKDLESIIDDVLPGNDQWLAKIDFEDEEAVKKACEIFITLDDHSSPANNLLPYQPEIPQSLITKFDKLESAYRTNQRYDNYGNFCTLRTALEALFKKTDEIDLKHEYEATRKNLLATFSVLGISEPALKCKGLEENLVLMQLFLRRGCAILQERAALEYEKKHYSSYRSDTIKTIKAESPKSYQAIWNNTPGSPLQKALALLIDYTKNNSRLRRIYTLHWNRNHVAEVVALTRRKFTNIEELLEVLGQFELKELSGSLSKRIGFIFANAPDSVIQKDLQQSHSLRDCVIPTSLA